MTNVVHEYIKNTQKKSGVFLLKIRLFFYCSVFIFLALISFIILRIDFTVAEDPLVRLYDRNRWLLITTWFNMTLLVYTPICIYCDWRELRRTDDAKHVKLLSKIRFVCFTGFLYPAAMFANTLFWRLWIKNRELVAPATVDVLVPMWMQHCMHTVTLAVIMLDLLLVPRKRPKNLTFGAALLTLFITVYAFMCAHSIINDIYIYPVLRLFTGFNYIPLVLYASVEHFLFFTIQWFVIDFVWGRKMKVHSPFVLPGCIQLDKREAKRVN